MSSSPIPALSVLDLVPVRAGQTSAQAVAASLDLASRADRLGFRRYWFAEHHNMPSVASTTPPVLIAAAAARTSRIRVGSGGVMLPNHSPLVVAEQFAALEALAPGRIDLGIGRAPGSDPVITQLLRQSGTTSDVERFPDHIRDILSLVSPDGASVRFTSGGTYDVRATPAATGTPEVWLLGSSDYSAQLAAALGLPYVFANHFSGQGLERALDLYRTQFEPSEAHPTPVTFLTANVDRCAHLGRGRGAVAPVPADDGEASHQPAAHHARDGGAGAGGRRRLRRHRPSRSWPRPGRTGSSAPANRWQRSSRAFAARFGVDEVMISPIAGAYDGDPMDAAPGRAETLELLAAAR